MTAWPSGATYTQPVLRAYPIRQHRRRRVLQSADRDRASISARRAHPRPARPEGRHVDQTRRNRPQPRPRPGRPVDFRLCPCCPGGRCTRHELRSGPSSPTPSLPHRWSPRLASRGPIGGLRTDRKAAARWLASAPQFVPQPWHELAQVYDRNRNGQPADARFLRLSAAHKTTRQAPWWSQPPRRGLRLLVGYGYLPLLAGAWLLAAILDAFLIISTQANSFLPSNPTALQSARPRTRPPHRSPE